jgi:hypothetical protein
VLADSCESVLTGAVQGEKVEGEYDLWQGCEPDGALVLQLFTLNEPGYLAVLKARMVDQRDITALRQFFSQLNVTPPIETPQQEQAEGG